MTLVVSEVSRHGVTMVGDSAITLRSGGIVKAESGASKIHYSPRLNMGFAIWGNAMVRCEQIDTWLSHYLDTVPESFSDIDRVAQNLATDLGAELAEESKPWSQLYCGIHVTGYKSGLPRLWHIHCGHAHEAPHEPRLYMDYPEDQGWSDDYYRTVMVSPGATFSCHLRNGYTPHYALLFDRMVEYSNNLRDELGIAFPQDTLAGHLEFHKVLVRFVAGALVAAGKHPGVNDQLSILAFTDNGAVIDERLPIVDWLKSETFHPRHDAWFSL